MSSRGVDVQQSLAYVTSQQHQPSKYRLENSLTADGNVCGPTWVECNRVVQGRHWQALLDDRYKSGAPPQPQSWLYAQVTCSVTPGEQARRARPGTSGDTAVVWCRGPRTWCTWLTRPRPLQVGQVSFPLPPHTLQGFSGAGLDHDFSPREVMTGALKRCWSRAIRRVALVRATPAHTSASTEGSTVVESSHPGSAWHFMHLGSLLACGFAWALQLACGFRRVRASILRTMQNHKFAIRSQSQGCKYNTTCTGTLCRDAALAIWTSAWRQVEEAETSTLNTLQE